MNTRKNDIPKRGTVVTVKKIPGPKMIVLATGEDGDVKVGWFDLALKYHTAILDFDLLLSEQESDIDNGIKVDGISNERLNRLINGYEFQAAMKSNQKINAIKIAREVLGIGLKDAKDLVDGLSTRSFQ